MKHLFVHVSFSKNNICDYRRGKFIPRWENKHWNLWNRCALRKIPLNLMWAEHPRSQQSMALWDWWKALWYKVSNGFQKASSWLKTNKKTSAFEGFCPVLKVSAWHKGLLPRYRFKMGCSQTGTWWEARSQRMRPSGSSPETSSTVDDRQTLNHLN